ncbi:hypothetical protein BT69DRAFT_1287398 [Atractiella rhizophila]|nr:hypothetical protein BT69DRAFT_1287398 [Atractiella rhizophila]
MANQRVLLALLALHEVASKSLDDGSGRVFLALLWLCTISVNCCPVVVHRREMRTPSNVPFKTHAPSLTS